MDFKLIYSLFWIEPSTGGAFNSPITIKIRIRIKSFIIHFDTKFSLDSSTPSTFFALQQRPRPL